MLFKLIPGVRTNLRNKLLALGLFPIVLMMPISLALAIYWGSNFSYDQLFLKVNTDLSVSHDAFIRSQQDYLDTITRLGDSYTFRSMLESENVSGLSSVVQAIKKQAGFSYLHITDSQGNWLFENTAAGLGLSWQSDMSRMAQRGETVAGVELFPAEALATEGLLSRVLLPLVPTPRAVPTDRTVENRGMMIRVLYPIQNERHQILAILDGGVLLNGNFQFVDAIRDLVYGEGSLPENSIGTVTVFLEDVRISTNVPLKEGERALGTRVSREVRDDVFGRGNIWIDLAFVVNDWYISAYEPIYNFYGERVGMLYAGFLEKPFRVRLWQALIGLIVLFLVLTALSMFIAVRGARNIFRPVAEMSRVVRVTRSGNLDSRIGIVDVEDELGELAIEFDAMLDKLQARNQQIQLAADQLESKVTERTEELSTRNRELQRTINLLRETRQQLVVAEKLAALGELTAGVAHEINNPLAVMLGNMDLLRTELGSVAMPVDHEIDLIIEQIYRIQEIVNNLLLYSRPSEYSGFTQEVDVNHVLDATLGLVRHMIDDNKTQIHLSFEASHWILINQQELQQVLVNLLINAVHALPETGGNIFLQTRDWLDRGVVIEVRDDGVGIHKEDISKVFNAFYSTKEIGKGTGIGLSISYSLVKRYGGNITVDSKRDEGTSFKVWLLTEPEFVDDEQALVDQLKLLEEAS